MDPARIFQLITNSTLLATRLLSVSGGPLVFSQARYCVVVAEDTPLSSSLATVKAIHSQGTVGAEVRYTLTQGKIESHFTINPSSGIIYLAQPLDYELKDKHEFVVRSEGGGSAAHALVRVVVADVNDNPPVFMRPDPHVTVIEEDDRDLPLPLAKVEAHDADDVDAGRLLYTLSGDGVDGYTPDDAYFEVNSRSGEVMQRKALDRDPPKGRDVWKLKVTVRDGQMLSSGAWDDHSNLAPLAASASSTSSSASSRIRRLARSTDGGALVRLDGKRAEVISEEVIVKRDSHSGVDGDGSDSSKDSSAHNDSWESSRRSSSSSSYSSSGLGIVSDDNDIFTITITTTTAAANATSGSVRAVTLSDQREIKSTLGETTQGQESIFRLSGEELDSGEHNSGTAFRRRSHLAPNDTPES
ncbi:putative neural-cadherin 2 isoform X3 [Portunus trituberculatus]|uniref:putative neural-cadherin 2 isoform X3 n=1 Tax=Portunus trituberculatus TaxID=210409 RepID=UPI001E1CF144|nr:putative neural-cadherin 2 isoform X3 [Portunus trituberculatus]